VLSISAVIPTYNRAALVRRAIDSVLAQTRPIDEIIVVDDGSSDKTREVVTAYGAAVRYICQENRGIAGARNRGIRESRFDWVAFLDDDDEWLPDKIAKQVQALEKCPEASVCYTGIRYAPIDGGAERCFVPIKAESLLPKARLSIPFTPSTMVVRRKALDAVGGFMEGLRFAEDWHIIVRLAFRFKFVGVMEPLVRMNQQPFSLSRQHIDDLLRTELSIVDTMLIGLTGLSRKIWRMKVLSTIYYRAAIGKRTTGGSGMKYLLQSLFYWPTPWFQPKRYWTLILEIRDRLKGLLLQVPSQHS
jgi:glycosyltransferase involved in cell wall biosynthesis